MDDFNVDAFMSNVPVEEATLATPEVTEVTKAKGHGGLIFVLGLGLGAAAMHFVHDWVERRKTKNWWDEEISKASILKKHKDTQQEVPTEADTDDYGDDEEPSEDANN